MQNQLTKEFERQLLLVGNIGLGGSGGLRTQGIMKKSRPNKPLVTIITTVYNGEKHLEETIRNIINQTYENFEYIMIDGGSTDNSIEIIKKYEDKIDYWVSEKDNGIGDAFNKGIRLSAGEYINFQGDGDGFYSEHSIEEAMKDIDPNRDMLISGKIQRISDDGQVMFVTKHQDIFKKQSLMFRMSVPHQGLFTHIRMFEEYGLFDIHNTFCMDYEHLLRAYHEFPNVVMKDIIVARWRADGLGEGRTLDILKEYNDVKCKNKIASPLTLKLIHNWTLFKYYLKPIFQVLKILK